MSLQQMDPLNMSRKILLSTEFSWTFIAFKRFFLDVCHQMSLQLGASAELFLALYALERFFSCMSS